MNLKVDKLQENIQISSIREEVLKSENYLVMLACIIHIVPGFGHTCPPEHGTSYTLRGFDYLKHTPYMYYSGYQCRAFHSVQSSTRSGNTKRKIM